MERATPKFSIEGNEWFAEHETPAPARENVPQQNPEKRYKPDRAD